MFLSSKEFSHSFNCSSISALTSGILLLRALASCPIHHSVLDYNGKFQYEWYWKQDFDNDNVNCRPSQSYLNKKYFMHII